MMDGLCKMTSIVGTQFGDEGKGKIVDYFAEKFDYGGSNAGHTVYSEGKKYSFHLLPRPNCKVVIGNGVVIHIPTLLKEIQNASDNGIQNVSQRILISERSHIADQLSDAKKGKDRYNFIIISIGTTGRGIGPTYASKKAREFLAPMVFDTVYIVNNAIDKNHTVLAEGANAHMLDIDFGTYPFVTSSNCSIGGICTGLGVSPNKMGEIVGVIKAYTTRVGFGHFPTELHDNIFNHLSDKGKEFGTTTGRKRRCGWLDISIIRTFDLIANASSFALTKLDVLDGLEEIFIALNYIDHKGNEINYVPASIDVYSQVKVNYAKFPGWKKSTLGCKKFDELPIEAQSYVKFIEKQLNKPSPGREDLIVR